MNDDLDFDPTADDLAEVEDLADDLLDVDDEDDYSYLDFDANVRDDRYSNSGVPAWSAWA